MGEYYRWVNVDKKEYLCQASLTLGISGMNHWSETMNFSAHFEICFQKSGQETMFFGWAMKKGFHKMLIM